ncbi:hypothetical protein JCM8547_009221 [Rhodosporidiobolus lusitaniae]
MTSENYLSTLPVELLTEIFKLSYGGDETTTGALSRTLLPYHRAEKFKHVVARSPEQVVELANFLEKCTPGHIGVAVTSVNVIAGATATAKDEVDRLFATFLRGRKLTIEVTTHAAAQTVLASLTSHAMNFANFGDEHYEDSKRWKAGPAPKTAPLLPRYALSPLITCCAALESLVLALSGFDEDVIFTYLLPKISPRITSVSLKSSPAPYLFDFGYPCDYLLPRFQNLTFLHLGEGIYKERTFVATLRALPRPETLVFDPATRPDPRILFSLVNGPRRHPFLKRIVVDSTYPGRRGWSAILAGRLHPEHQSSKYYVAPDWIVPEFQPQGGFDRHLPWSEDNGPFRPRALLDFVDEGKRGGVLVEGTAVTGAPIRLDWLEEAKACLFLDARARGLTQDVFDELVTKLDWIFDSGDVDGMVGTFAKENGVNMVVQRWEEGV